jgi:NADH dehydrogenase (ubiquinone) flavoprotein 2
MQRFLSASLRHRRLSTALPQHRNSPHNNPDTPFEFKDQQAVDAILNKYPQNYKASAIIPLLWIAQRQNNNWVPLSAMNKIAEIVQVAPIRVYETCTFYTMFNREPVGKFHVQVCCTTPCMVRGGYDILKACEEELGVGPNNETTSDQLFTLLEVECLGACVNAPMVQINDDFYEDLTPDSMKKLIRDLRDGKEVKVGPQTDRRNSEGPLGRTSLKGKVENYQVRDFENAKKEWEEKKAAAAAAAAQKQKK